MVRYYSTHDDENGGLANDVLEGSEGWQQQSIEKIFDFSTLIGFDCCKRLSYYFLSKRLSNLIKGEKSLTSHFSLLCTS